jgi:hypothetical protein
MKEIIMKEDDEDFFFLSLSFVLLNMLSSPFLLLLNYAFFSYIMAEILLPRRTCFGLKHGRNEITTSTFIN